MAMKILCWRANSPIEGRTEPMESKAAIVWMKTLKRNHNGIEYWLEDVPTERPDGFYWVHFTRLPYRWIAAEWRGAGQSGVWSIPFSYERYSDGDFAEIGPQVTREDNPPFHLNASDAQDALAAMVAAKGALEDAFAEPVLMVDLMRVIDRLEAYQQGKAARGVK